jgi:hypothetical protein
MEPPVATQADIRLTIKTGALRKLGVLAATETASAADDQLADGALGRLIDTLSADGDIRFHNLAIPEDAAHGLIVLLAAALADDFGVADTRAARLSAQAADERRALRIRGHAPASNDVAFRNY